MHEKFQPPCLLSMIPSGLGKMEKEQAGGLFLA